MRHGLALWVSIVLLAAGCNKDSNSGGSAPADDVIGGGDPPSVVPPPVVPPPLPNVPMETRTYSSSSSNILNPERGFHKWIDIVYGRDFSHLRSAGLTLGYASVLMSSYRNSSLPSSYINSIRSGLQAARDSGIKVILRFRYSDGFSDPDAPLSRILGHIAQLKPLMQEFSDVIAIYQAGFIGAWGEWHSSTNELDNPYDQGQVLNAMLDAVPSSRMIQVRCPFMKQDILGSTAVGSSDAHSGSDRARVGHHNDAFNASETDQGTYLRPVEPMKDWTAAESKYVVTGGESNTVNSLSVDGAYTISQLKRFHYSFLSSSYNVNVINAWASAGYLDDIQTGLGYRIYLREASWPEATAPGGVLTLRAKIKNSGYAAFYNKRPVFAVLTRGSARYDARIYSWEPRAWHGGTEFTVQTRLQLPAGIPAGTYRLNLWLPDYSTTLRDRPEYAVRLANSGIWDGATGFNLLTDSFRIEAGGAGPVDPTASTFVEIP